MDFLTIYLIVINVITFLIYGLDKRSAIKDRWRISEQSLIGLGFIGGPLGALLGMKIFHHKTRKWYFVLGNIIFLAGWSYYVIKVYFL